MTIVNQFLQILSSEIEYRNSHLTCCIEDNALNIDGHDIPILEEGYFVVEIEQTTVSIFHISDQGMTLQNILSDIKTPIGTFDLNNSDCFEELATKLRELDIQCSDEWHSSI